MSETPSRDIYRLTNTIIPRPIAFVSTSSSAGHPSFSLSYLILRTVLAQVAHNPPLISVSSSLSPKRLGMPRRIL
ncbi:hypothetical protein BV22DRAFT_1160818 [Leucogyrophana mollusca]|uniref:Uncharacterized protein n=1 Tax=Leucogyrophana mollusca TaxID=85980 RepID=A0ACB8BJR9_9AGAM|nr:hypothetical protein BV22DRAFT_1160818 [Leucogyrophana mollusca]